MVTIDTKQLKTKTTLISTSITPAAGIVSLFSSAISNNTEQEVTVKLRLKHLSGGVADYECKTKFKNNAGVYSEMGLFREETFVSDLTAIITFALVGTNISLTASTSDSFLTPIEGIVYQSVFTI